MLITPPPAVFNGYNIIVKNSPVNNVQLNLAGIDYTSANGSVRYIQLFSGVAVPVNGAVPLLSIKVAANGSGVWRALEGFPFPVKAPGLVVAISSTSGTLTIDASGAFDLELMVEEYAPAYIGQTAFTVVGDLTTGVDSLAVWSEATGATTRQFLKRIQAINLVAAVRYLVVYAVDTPNADPRISKPLVLITIPSSGSIDRSFDFRSGLRLLQNDSTGNYYGCTIKGATAITATSITFSAVSGFNIRAEFAAFQNG